MNPCILGICIICIIYHTSEATKVTNNRVGISDKDLSLNHFIERSYESPSKKCKFIESKFAHAVSNFTKCSIMSARPIRLCQCCLASYIQVIEMHHEFAATIDAEGNKCRTYYVNKDRIEIVEDSIKYVDGLWTKGNCDNCFSKFPNGTISQTPTKKTIRFNALYSDVEDCFKNHKNNNKNNTCIDCKQSYEHLTKHYIRIGEEYGERTCLDIVDTMNTTRNCWSEHFRCLPEKMVQTWLYAIIFFIISLPLIFYPLAYLFSQKQQVPILEQRRFNEVFVTSLNSEMNFGNRGHRLLINSSSFDDDE